MLGVTAVENKDTAPHGPQFFAVYAPGKRQARYRPYPAILVISSHTRRMW